MGQAEIRRLWFQFRSFPQSPSASVVPSATLDSSFPLRYSLCEEEVKFQICKYFTDGKTLYMHEGVGYLLDG